MKWITKFILIIIILIKRLLIGFTFRSVIKHLFDKTYTKPEIFEVLSLLEQDKHKHLIEKLFKKYHPEYFNDSPFIGVRGIMFFTVANAIKNIYDNEPTGLELWLKSPKNRRKLKYWEASIK